MEAVVLHKDLAKTLSRTSRFVSNRAQIPILSNLVLVASSNKLTVKATNLEISISSPLGASVTKEGEIAVPAKMFTELVASLHTEKVALKLKADVLHIEADGFSANLSGLNTADFPEIPVSAGTGFSLPADVFSGAITKVLFSSSPDDTRPALSGVLLFSDKKILSFVSSDGFRLSKKDVPLKEDVDIRVILPKTILLELSRICPEEDKVVVDINREDKQAIFLVGDSVLSSRLVEGEYPPFEKIIPASSSIEVNVSKDDFTAAIKSAAVFARDGANVLKISAGDEGLVVSAESSRSGNQESRIAAKVSGPEIAILYNYRYIEEFLGVVRGEGVAMKFNNSSSSGVFLDSADENYLHLIMPVKS